MLLVLGEPRARVLEAFRSAAKLRNIEVFFLQELAQEPHFTWRFDHAGSCSKLVIGDKKVNSSQIRGVLVQNPTRLEPAESGRPDRQYTQAERNAILFAWFSNLPCPVINRYPAQYWFAPGVSLSSWERLIRESGLKTAPAILSNVESELQEFAKSFKKGVIYAPLCDSDTYRVSTDQDWKGIAKMAAVCPVNLTWFVPPRFVACVVGDRVFWNRTVKKAMADCEPQLVQLARAAQLEFIEVHFVSDKDDFLVHCVEPFPTLEAFDGAVRNVIAAALLDRLDSGDR
jgi:hypothetical protein